MRRLVSSSPSQKGVCAELSVKGRMSDTPTEASEMFHKAKSAEKAEFSGFLVHSIATSDKVLRYGKFNQIEYSEHPTVVQRGDERTINIYAAVPDVA